jgi:ABC-type dipeptide/oligopeptide/nickel transport system permease component
LTVPEHASAVEAREVARSWKRWWQEHRTDFTTLDGPNRIAAMITETQFGRWVYEAVSEELGISASGASVLTVLGRRAPITLALLGLGLLGGYALGIVWGVAAAQQRASRFDSSTLVLSVALLAIPTTALGVALAPEGSAGLWVPGSLMVLLSAALVSRHQRAQSLMVLRQDYARTARALGAGPLTLARWTARGALTAVLSVLGVDLPALITASFVLEQAFGLKGLGPTTFIALSTGDLSWLMAIGLITTVAVALAQILSDELLARVDPRVRLAAIRARGGVG